jgi:hypothetical protein
MKQPFSLAAPALGLLLIGHVIIVLALCDFAARLHAGVTVEPLLYIGDFMRSVAVSYVLLWGAGLGLDYWGKTSRRTL